MFHIEDIYDQYVDKIYNFCLYRTGNRFVSEDITSETFLRLARSAAKITKNPPAYLYSICRHLIADYFRQNSKTVSLESLSAIGREPGVNPDSLSNVLFQEVVSAIHDLPEDQKDVLLLKYVQDLDNKTIAGLLEKSESSVKSLAHRGIETLRVKLNQIQQ